MYNNDIQEPEATSFSDNKVMECLTLQWGGFQQESPPLCSWMLGASWIRRSGGWSIRTMVAKKSKSRTMEGNAKKPKELYSNAAFIITIGGMASAERRSPGFL